MVRPSRLDAKSEAAALLAWYDRARRDLPWRAPPGQAAVPYAVWLSEIMLQQTTVAAVKPYFARFLVRWPDVSALAAAPLDDVLAAWAGLGYYARARNLHRCAVMVVKEHGGRFPDTEAELRTLPGLGAYTAAAIAAIAFGQRAVVVDGNVERVVARYFVVEQLLPMAKPRLRALADLLTPVDRAGDFAQSMMDLGATICTPRSPRCEDCPLASGCAAMRAGRATEFPRKMPKPLRPIRRGAAFVLVDPAGRVLVRRRPAKGLLASMSEPPGTDWIADAPLPEKPDDAPFRARWALAGSIEHVFTHFRLELAVFSARVTDSFSPPEGYRWVDPDGEEALPSVMAKAIARGISG